MQMTEQNSQSFTCPIQSASGLRVGCKGPFCAWWEWIDDEVEVKPIRPPSNDLFVNLAWAKEWIDAGWTAKIWEGGPDIPGRDFNARGRVARAKPYQYFGGWERPWPLPRMGCCGATKQAPVYTESA